MFVLPLLKYSDGPFLVAVLLGLFRLLWNVDYSETFTSFTVERYTLQLLCILSPKASSPLLYL